MQEQPSQLLSLNEITIQWEQLRPVLAELNVFDNARAVGCLEALRHLKTSIEYLVENHNKNSNNNNGTRTEPQLVHALYQQVSKAIGAVQIAVDSRNNQHNMDAPNYGGDPYSDYELGRTIRETIYGKVKLGRRRSDGVMVAIKLSNLAQMAQVNNLENPEQEIQVMWNMSRPVAHPNVVQLYDVYRCRQFHWTILELCSGGEFFSIVERQGRFNDPMARAYFRQLLSGVKHIHSRGYCHRDLSLENILLDEHQNLKICDFGMGARLPPNDVFVGQGMGGDRPGKIGYMAPEIFAGHNYNGRAADLYSCGVILFIMLTATPPYSIPHRGQDARFQYIQAGRLLDLLERWNFANIVHPHAADLCQRLLLPEASRPTIEQIEAHPWMQIQ